MGISQATLCNWKKKYGGLSVSEVRRLKQLEEENNRLKKLVGDLSLDKEMLQGYCEKSSEGSPAARAGQWVDPGLQGKHETRLVASADVQFVVLLQGASER